MKVIVVGYYNKQNLGDELYKGAFKNLWPDKSFVFTDLLTKEMASKYDIVIFGGGSFLDGAPFVEDGVIEILRDKTVLYISVGAETDIHPGHSELLSNAKLIAIRNGEYLDKIKAINSNVMVIPDLVYSFGTKTKINRLKRSILICPNINILPQHFSPHWMHSSFDWFKNEMAKTLDELVERDYMVRFLSMENGDGGGDKLVAQTIIGAMKYRGSYMVGDPHSYEELNATVCEFETVVSQRLHAAIAAELSMTASIIIGAHDKLKATHFRTGTFIPYFEFSKRAFDEALHNSEKQMVRVISPDIFKGLQSKVDGILAKCDMQGSKQEKS